MKAWTVPTTVAFASLVFASSAAGETVAPAANPPAPAYEDRLIEGGNLAPAESAELPVYNPSGLPRSWRVEGFASRTDQGDTKRYENGMVLSARLDTLEYGAFTLDATLRGPNGGGLVTLWQRAMPFDNGWVANNGIGMLNTPLLDMARQQFRFSLPTFPIAGVSSEWIRRGSLQVQVSAGEPGTYDGLRLSGFSGLHGRMTTAGIQWEAARDVQVGAQLVDARDVEAGLDNVGAPGKTSARAVYGSLAWHDGRDRLQLNVLDSEANAGPHRMGAWIDGETMTGRFRHNYGGFRFDPGLTWGYTPITSDLQGAYYRVNYASQQWLWSAGVDSVGSVSGTGLEGTFLTGNLRYQVDHALGVGGGANVRRSASDAGSVFAFVDKITALGTTRMQVDTAVTQGGQNAGQWSLDQAWATRVGLRLSTTLTVGRERTPDARRRRGGFAAFGGMDVTNRLSIDGSIRWGREWQDPGSVVTNGRYANVGLVWRINPNWSLLATYYDNRVEFPLFTGITPLIPVVEPAIVVPKDRAVFLTVRYEDRAGTPIAPLGGAPGAGAGTLVGFIFYDENDDGRRGANEKGAANVTVVLDGRFGTRTGTDGRFEFPLVAAGPHAIVVIPDNLALPYAVADEGKREVVVRTRETTTLEIAAQRVK